MPIKELDCYRSTGPGGETFYLIRKGWPQFRALLDFLDDKFPTWSDEDKRKWEQDRGHK